MDRNEAVHGNDGLHENIFRWIESVFATVTDHTCNNIISREIEILTLTIDFITIIILSI
jgi:hypothetical protein